MPLISKILITLVIIFSSITIHPIIAQQIEISYDFKAAEKLIDIFNKKELTDKDFTSLIELKGIKAYLKKMKTFFEDANEKDFKASLKAAASGQPLKNDLFLYKNLIPKIKTVKQLINKIKDNESQLLEETTLLLKPYVPEYLHLKIKVNTIMGVIGGGWTFDEEPNTFYIDLTSFGDDIKGLCYLASHEIYHLIQYRFMKITPDKYEHKVEYILHHLIKEGAAVYVADFSKVNIGGSYIDFNKKEYNRNFRRIRSNFKLFELILQDAYSNNNVSIDELYNIGFSGMYQSPLYYVGYHIIQLTEEYLGKTKLIELLKEAPHKLIIEYNKLLNKYKISDDRFIALSDSIIEILNAID